MNSNWITTGVPTKPIIAVDPSNVPNVFGNQADAEAFISFCVKRFDIGLDPTWSDSISEYLLALSNGREKLTVEFSDRIELRTYDPPTLPEIKTLIKTFWPINDMAKKWVGEILDAVKSKRDLKKAADDLAPIIAECADRKQTDFGDSSYDERIDKIRKKISDWASAGPLTLPVLGRYIHEPRRIVLFSNNIETCSKKGKELQQYEETFCHEFFHAFHYFITINHIESPYSGISDYNYISDIVDRRDLTRSVVVESLASYYQNKYCAKYGFSTKISDSWKKYMPAVYPYSGARYISGADHFMLVFTESIDMDIALRVLLMGTKVDRFKQCEGTAQFVCIKNKVRVEKTSAQSATTTTVSDAAPKHYVDYGPLFKQYLIDEAQPPKTKNTADKYKSYVSLAFKNCLGLNDDILSCVNYFSRIHLANLVIEKLQNAVYLEEEIKKVSDWLSALGALIEFFEAHIHGFTGDINLLPETSDTRRRSFEEFAKRHQGEEFTMQQIQAGAEVFFGATLYYKASDFAKPEILLSRSKNNKELFVSLDKDKYRVI